MKNRQLLLSRSSRAFVAKDGDFFSAYQHSVQLCPDTFSLFGVRIHNATMGQALADLLAYIKKAQPANIAFVNADCLNKAWNDKEYGALLNRFDKVYADGSGIKLASLLHGRHLLDNVNGTDLFPLLCRGMAEQGASLFLLGGQPGVARACSRAMQDINPGLRIAGTCHGYFSATEENDILEQINASGADVLLVGFGAPLQERWIAEHSSALKPAVRIGVGGLFDFYSGRIARAPLWLRRIGMEWIWRLVQEPKRMWRRYLLGNPLFLWRAVLNR